MRLTLARWPWGTSITLRLALFRAVLDLGPAGPGLPDRAYRRPAFRRAGSGYPERQARTLVERALARVQSPDDLADLARRLDDARAGFSGLVFAVALDANQVVFAGQGGDFPGPLLSQPRATPSLPSRVDRGRWAALARDCR